MRCGSTTHADRTWIFGCDRSCKWMKAWQCSCASLGTVRKQCIIACVQCAPKLKIIILRKDYQLNLQEEISDLHTRSIDSQKQSPDFKSASKSRTVILCNPSQSTTENVFRKKAWMEVPTPWDLLQSQSGKVKMFGGQKRQAQTKKVQLVHMKIKGQQNYISSKDGQTW